MICFHHTLSLIWLGIPFSLPPFFNNFYCNHTNRTYIINHLIHFIISIRLDRLIDSFSMAIVSSIDQTNRIDLILYDVRVQLPLAFSLMPSSHLSLSPSLLTASHLLNEFIAELVFLSFTDPPFHR